MTLINKGEDLLYLLTEVSNIIASNVSILLSRPLRISSSDPGTSHFNKLFFDDIFFSLRMNFDVMVLSMSILRLNLDNSLYTEDP